MVNEDSSGSARTRSGDFLAPFRDMRPRGGGGGDEAEGDRARRSGDEHAGAGTMDEEESKEEGCCWSGVTGNGNGDRWRLADRLIAWQIGR